MVKRAIPLAVLTLLLLLAFVPSFGIRLANAWSGDITIKSDGSIDPPTAPISRSGNIYSLTDDVQGSITINADNIVVNGMGHIVQYAASNPNGIYLGSRTNVKIMKIAIENCDSGIYLSSSNQNIITQTNISSNSIYGIYLESSSNNTIVGNSITANSFAGIYLDSSSANNRIFHNNFMNNIPLQAHSESSSNIWDDGYPSGGNYWSDYAGIDQKCGPNQDHPGSDGMGDTAYAIESNNQDNYPLMSPWTPPVGDITGPDGYPDGKVNLADVFKVALNFGTYMPPRTPTWDPLWGPLCDINNDGAVNLIDYFKTVLNFGNTA